MIFLIENLNFLDEINILKKSNSFYKIIEFLYKKTTVLSER